MDMEDTAETSWFSDQLGLEDPFMSDQYDITDFFDEELSAALGMEVFQNSLSQQSPSKMIPRNSSATSLSASSNMEVPQSQNGIEIPPKLQNQNYYNNSVGSGDQITSVLIPSPAILAFGNMPNPQNSITGGEDDASVSDMMITQASYTNVEEASKSVHSKKKTCGRTRPPSQTYDHIIAERKRREQLSQQFVALSAIVPGLKKMDKTSVLGDTINYMKQLQDREKALEEQATMQTMESMVLVNKSQLIDDDNDNDDDDDDDIDDKESSDHDHQAAASSSIEQPLPDIEAKLCDNHVLVRILCEKHKGVLVKMLCELERLNLAVTSTNVAPFGSLALDITIITEMRKDFNMSMEEVVKVLGSSLGRRRPDDRS